MHRKPRNLVAQYMVRGHNRMGSQYDFSAFPCYISTLNNIRRDDFSMISVTDVPSYASHLGVDEIDTLPTLRRRWGRMLANHPIILPCDSPDRARRITQFFEKRMVRRIPLSCPPEITLPPLGMGVNRRGGRFLVR